MSNIEKGLIYGAALGSAVGLQTRDLDEKTIKIRFPGGLTFPYSHRTKTEHESGDWSNDIDQLVLVCMSFVGDSDFVTLLRDWSKKGFSDLGDSIRQLPNELHKTIETGKASAIATQDVVVRNIVLGTKSNWCKLVPTYTYITCSHPAIEACSMITCYIIHMATTPEYKYVFQKVCEESINIMESIAPDYLVEWRRGLLCVIHGNLDRIDFMQSIFTATLSGILALKDVYNGKHNYKKQILNLISYGGTSDTNAAVYSAVYGCHMGYNSLPYDWIAATIHPIWLDGILKVCFSEQ